MRILSDGTTVLTLGFSPCPNDTFIFDALVNGKIDTGKLRFEPVLDDVEALNQRAIRGEWDVTKLSFRAYADCSNEYILMNSGSALGFGVGPLLVALQESPLKAEARVLVPGERTTAHFLFRLYYPHVNQRIPVVFSAIEDAVVEGKADAGVIIHENRFTYQQKGLRALADLGALWEKETGQPIPLGGIAGKRRLGTELLHDLDRLIRKSVEHAFAHPAQTENYVARHAQAMDPDVRQQHIQLYVNDYSLDLGDHGRKAVRYFFDKAITVGALDHALTEPMFV